MKRTPAPESTAWAAASIWSGVGEVKTWPGQAASSIPTPTRPACIGSCPDPPPEMSATLPARVGSARVTNTGSGWTLIRSAWAAPKPRSAPVSTASTRLTSFFTIVLPRLAPRPSGMAPERAANCRYQERRRGGARILVPARALAQERGPAPGGDHAARRRQALGRRLRQGRERAAGLERLGHRRQHVEHGLGARVRLAAPLDRLHAGRERLGRFLTLLQGLTGRHQKTAVEGSRGAADGRDQHHPGLLQRVARLHGGQ